MNYYETMTKEELQKLGMLVAKCQACEEYPSVDVDDIFGWHCSCSCQDGEGLKTFRTKVEAQADWNKKFGGIK